jgi:hypothetical protein
MLISRDPGLDLRVEHSHGWGDPEVSSGGHYHYDTTPEEVEYLGYYNLAEFIYRKIFSFNTLLFFRIMKFFSIIEFVVLMGEFLYSKRD